MLQYVILTILCALSAIAIYQTSPCLSSCPLYEIPAMAAKSSSILRRALLYGKI